MGIQQMLLGAGGFQPTLVIHNAAGSGTEIIPAGASQVTMEVWGPTNPGGLGFGSGCTAQGGGGSGASGYSESFYVCSGLQTISWFVGGGGSGNPSTVSSGTLSITTMTANSGVIGGNAVLGSGGSGGPGGIATGGNLVNTTGASGNSGDSSGGGAGGNPTPGVNASLGSIGGNGGRNGAQGGRTLGSDGGIAFFYK